MISILMKRIPSDRIRETINITRLLFQSFLCLIRTIPSSKLIKHENIWHAISTLNNPGRNAVPYKTNAITVAKTADLLNTFSKTG